MNKVKRYDIDEYSCDGDSGECHATMEEDPDGGYVRAADHDELEAEVVLLRLAKNAAKKYINGHGTNELLLLATALDACKRTT